MKKRFLSFLRAHRTNWALSTEELARLLGREASMVCRLEKSGEPPSGRVAIGYEIIFGDTLQEMFAGLYDQVEDAIMARAARLHDQLEGKTDRKSGRKRELLNDMMRRATARGAQP